MGEVRICPVTLLARLITRRVSRYKSNELKWKIRDHRPINLVASKNGISLVSSNQILHHLRATA